MSILLILNVFASPSESGAGIAGFVRLYATKGAEVNLQRPLCWGKRTLPESTD